MNFLIKGFFTLFRQQLLKESELSGPIFLVALPIRDAIVDELIKSLIERFDSLSEDLRIARTGPHTSSRNYVRKLAI
jgi:hypothetical protein